MTPTDPAKVRLHAFGDDALADHDAVGLAEEIRARRVSAAEVVDAAIHRVSSLQPDLNGLVEADFDRARERARGGDGEGFFAGVPTFIKDNADVAGLPTRHGTRSFVARPALADGGFASMFFGQGVISLGKTELSEFGFSPSAEFWDRAPVRNPWHTGYSSGASSAGSAVFVAAGAVPIAHANDGGGSIRIPAAVNGLVGLKPSRDRVPQDRFFRTLPLRIIADGVVTRTVRDTAAFLREVDRTHRNVRLPPIGDVRGPGRRRLRVAMVVDSVVGTTDPEVVAVVRDTGALLESLGHHVTEIPAPVPDFFVDDFLAYWAFLATSMLFGGRRMLDPTFDRNLTDNLSRGLARHGLRTLPRFPLTVTRLAASARVSKRFFTDHDLVLTPTLARPTPELGWLTPDQSYEVLIERVLSWANFTPLQNATGDPAVSLPMGMSRQGLPIGIHLGAGRGQEARLLEVAYELEEARPFIRIQG